MWEVAGGILLAIALLYMAPLILMGGYFIVIAIFAVIGLVIIFNYPQLLVSILAIALIGMIINLFDRKPSEGEWIINKGMGSVTPYGENKEAENPTSLRRKKYLTEKKKNRIKSIGGIKKWLLDLYKRAKPAITVNQRIKKIKYLEVERPKQLEEVSLALDHQFELEEKKLKQKEDIIAQIHKEKFDAFSASTTKRITQDFCSKLEKMKRLFSSQKNVEFEISESGCCVKITGNTGVAYSYHLGVDVRISQSETSQFYQRSPVTKFFSDTYPTLIFYQIKDEQQKNILSSDTTYSAFSRNLKNRIIQNAATSEK